MVSFPYLNKKKGTIPSSEASAPAGYVSINYLKLIALNNRQIFQLMPLAFT
ncbi:hypothetical protein BAZSYMA_ACONTIG268228_1 [Bathymodiolus azoricus thioautotrophic gill symbiont]|jgi:hypothetical protein|uniref:Uncharacterized protein n=1 Tax=Bathymodiolus azoricus thioautotrophic gill symbiont TaxID=235205 RepID=A0A1H6N2G7_9GAMM|nr:hypothetical protein BAZSYMA_ACONTIG268228_1 [Bathymodiolus azoricus thioautotrophic gill symbiont]